MEKGICNTFNKGIQNMLRTPTNKSEKNNSNQKPIRNMGKKFNRLSSALL